LGASGRPRRDAGLALKKAGELISDEWSERQDL
jgi:hypothetical protein